MTSLKVKSDFFFKRYIQVCDSTKLSIVYVGFLVRNVISERVPQVGYKGESF